MKEMGTTATSFWLWKLSQNCGSLKHVIQRFLKNAQCKTFISAQEVITLKFTPKNLGGLPENSTALVRWKKIMNLLNKFWQGTGFPKEESNTLPWALR